MIQEKPKLKIDWATHEAAKYACEKWHYSKLKPAGSTVHFGVWENGIFIGVVLFGRGVAPNLLRPYGLKPNDGCELIRIALKQHQSPVTKIVAVCLKLLKQKYPGLKLIVSFADPHQNHVGGIYQGGNWIYAGKTSDSKIPIVNGKEIHQRTLNHLSKVKRSSMSIKYESRPGKHRYLMALDDETRKRILPLSKPYPKRVSSVESGTTSFQEVGGGESPTDTLQSKSNNKQNNVVS